MERNTIWSPYYKITVKQQGTETVVEVNNIWHQSMAPVGTKEYFYQWPYMVFGDTFKDVLILGAGSGTDVAAALKHNVASVDAVEIDPAILRLGKQGCTPTGPYSDPRVHPVADDARHFLRTTQKKYDLVVFALIDSLTLQSAFSGVRLESYMFTEESFRAVQQRAQAERRARGLQLLPRAMAGGPAGQHRRRGVRRRADGARAPAKDQLGVMVVGPRLKTLAAYPDAAVRGDRLQPGRAAGAAGHAHARRGDRAGHRQLAVPLHARAAPAAHYTSALAVVLLVSVAARCSASCAARCASGRGSSSSWAPGSCCSRRSPSSSSPCCGDRRGWWRR